MPCWLGLCCRRSFGSAPSGALCAYWRVFAAVRGATVCSFTTHFLAIHGQPFTAAASSARCAVLAGVALPSMAQRCTRLLPTVRPSMAGRSAAQRAVLFVHIGGGLLPSVAQQCARLLPTVWPSMASRSAPRRAVLVVPYWLGLCRRPWRRGVLVYCPRPGHPWPVVRQRSERCSLSALPHLTRSDEACGASLLKMT